MRVISHVVSVCRQQPLLTGVVAAGSKGALADLMSQTFFQDGDYKPSRTLAFGLWNTLYCGFAVYFLYSVLLPRVLPLVLANGARHPRAALHTVLSVGFDNFLATPFLCLPTYYLCHTAIEASWQERRRPLELAATSLQLYAAESRETLLLSWGLWIPIHIATFSVIPPPLRTHWSAACSFVTLTLMSLLQSTLERRRLLRLRGGSWQLTIPRHRNVPDIRMSGMDEFKDAWDEFRQSPRRLAIASAGAAAVTLGGNFLGATSGLLSLAPEASRRAQLDRYYAVQGFRRSVDPEEGRFSFLYPERLLKGQRGYQQDRRAKGLPIPLAPGLPVVAPGYGLARGYSVGGEENLSVVVGELGAGVRKLSDWYSDADSAADWLVRRSSGRGVSATASLLDARQSVTPSGAPVYLVEYTVDAPGYGTVHHLSAFAVTRAESHVTLSYRVPEARWRASEADARQAVGSLDVLL